MMSFSVNKLDDKMGNLFHFCNATKSNFVLKPWKIAACSRFSIDSSFGIQLGIHCSSMLRKGEC